MNEEAQLAHSLTKNHEQAQMNLFYKLGGRWRLVYDETYTSTRKRRPAGTTVLESVAMLDVKPRPDVLPDEEGESSEDSSI